MSIPVHDDPIDLFKAWFTDADRPDILDRTAMTLATATPEGVPSARMVLLKEADDRGFVFYTNLESQKGQELRANPHAALCFYWAPLGRQVRVQGPVLAVSEEEADAYFASRERQSRIGAWASDQSRPLQGRFDLEKRVATFAARFAVGPIPRPPHWSGFRLVHEVVVFWQQGAFRLHDRLRYQRTDGGWRHQWLYP